GCPPTSGAESRGRALGSGQPDVGVLIVWKLQSGVDRGCLPFRGRITEADRVHCSDTTRCVVTPWDGLVPRVHRPAHRPPPARLLPVIARSGTEARNRAAHKTGKSVACSNYPTELASCVKHNGTLS